MNFCIKPKIGLFVVGRVFVIYGKGYSVVGINNIVKIDWTDVHGFSVKFGKFGK